MHDCKYYSWKRIMIARIFLKTKLIQYVNTPYLKRRLLIQVPLYPIFTLLLKKTGPKRSGQKYSKHQIKQLEKFNNQKLFGKAFPRIYVNDYGDGTITLCDQKLQMMKYGNVILQDSITGIKLKSKMELTVQPIGILGVNLLHYQRKLFRLIN